MKTFTAKQLHNNPSEVYRAATKGPVKITHKFHGDFVISSTESPQAYIYKQIGDESTCYSESDALAEIAKSRPSEYMRHVTVQMLIDHT